MKATIDSDKLERMVVNEVRMQKKIDAMREALEEIMKDTGGGDLSISTATQRKAKAALALATKGAS